MKITKDLMLKVDQYIKTVEKLNVSRKDLENHLGKYFDFEIYIGP